MDAWNAKVPIWYKICEKLWKIVQYLLIMVIFETMTIIFVLLA